MGENYDFPKKSPTVNRALAIILQIIRKYILY